VSPFTPNELRALREEYGSIDAAIEARPELADELHAVRRASDAIRRQLQTLSAALDAGAPPRLVSPARPETMISAKAMAEAEIAKFEIALDRHARRQREEAKHTPVKKRRYTSQEFRQRVLFDVIRRLGAGEKLTDIARADEIDRKLVAKIRDAAAGKRWQIERGQTEGYVVLVRMRETAS
jgi:hypothetical protein